MTSLGPCLDHDFTDSIGRLPQSPLPVSALQGPRRHRSGRLRLFNLLLRLAVLGGHRQLSTFAPRTARYAILETSLRTRLKLSPSWQPSLGYKPKGRSLSLAYGAFSIVCRVHSSWAMFTCIGRRLHHLKRSTSVFRLMDSCLFLVSFCYGMTSFSALPHASTFISENVYVFDCK